MVQRDTVRDGLEGGCYFYKIERDTNKYECISSQKMDGAPFFLFYILPLSLMKNNLWLFLIKHFFHSWLSFKHIFSLNEKTSTVWIKFQI